MNTCEARKGDYRETDRRSDERRRPRLSVCVTGQAWVSRRRSRVLGTDVGQELFVALLFVERFHLFN